MNYVAIYDNLIRTRKERVLVTGAYYENHHIVMKSMGGSDEPANLVKLTAREHFLAHWLLWRIHKNRVSALAFWGMCYWKSKKSKREIPSSRSYAEAREAHIRMRSELMSQRIPIESICENCGDHVFDFYRKRKNCSKSCAASGHMKKFRQSRFGPKTEEEKKRIKESWKQFSPEMRHARGLKIWETRRKNALQE